MTMTDDEIAARAELEQMYIHAVGVVMRVLDTATPEGRRRVMRLIADRQSLDIADALDATLDERDTLRTRVDFAVSRLERLAPGSHTVAILQGRDQ